MKKLKLYRVGITKNGETWFETSEIEVVAENKDWIVLNNSGFDKVTKSKDWEFSYDRLHKPRIIKRDNETGYFKDDKYWGNGVYYTLYSYQKKRPETIKREIKEFLDDKFGYLVNIDLSFIR